MKTTAIRLICLLAICAPLRATAQKNIKAAFDAVITYPQAEIEDSHFLSKDKVSGIKDGQDDIYDFELPVGKSKLIKEVWDAFDKDAETAYVLKKGRNKGKERKISVYSGGSEVGGYGSIFIDAPGADYVYALFAPTASEDPKGSHRYAYGFCCKEENGMLKGRLVINYATTAEYRQQAERESQIQRIMDIEKIQKQANDAIPQQSWFEQVMAHLNGMEKADSKTRWALATKVYQLAKDVKSFPEATSQDKYAARQIIQQMRLKTFSDPVLKELLLQCERVLN